MKRTRFSEEQIIGVLKEHEAGAKTADLCRRHGISEATFYNWKSRFGGLDVSEARRLRALESENAKLKKLLAEAHLDCVSAWNKDPVLGVIGVQSGPPVRVHSGFHFHGGQDWNAGRGDDCEDPSRVFRSRSADQGDLP
jgi:putative transposase